ncbi:MAG: hypothetical protein DRJ14_01100, partial [Acidobacteria bacterium]
QVFEMRVPLGKLTVIDTPSLEMGNERAKRGLATPRCLFPALRSSQLSARYAWAAEKGVGVIIVKVRVRERRELANHCLLTFLILSSNIQHLSSNIRRNAPQGQ